MINEINNHIMKIKSIIIVALMAVPAMTGAQPRVAATDAQGYYERGKLMYESKNYVGAIDQLTHVHEMGAPDDLLEQADYYLALSRFERDEATGLSSLQAFLERYPSSLLTEDVHMRIGNYYFYHGEFGEALVAYSHMRDHSLNDDSNEDVLYRMAYSNLQLGYYDDAAKLYSSLAETRRYGNATLFYNAYIDYANKRYDAALSKFSQIDRTGDLGYQAQYYECQILYGKREYDSVLELGQSLLEDDANDYFTPEINRLVGESYYHKGNEQLARQYLNKYVETTQDPVVRSAAYALGSMDYRAGDYENAAARMAMVTGDEDAMGQSAYLYLGQAKRKLGDNTMAIKAFEQAASMNHDPAVKETAFYNYAVALSQGSANPFGKSIDLFEEFLNNYPNSKNAPQVETYLVDAYMNTGDYEKALASISHIKKPSKNVLRAKQCVLYNMGSKALADGDNATAAKYLQQAIDVGSYDKKIQNESRLWLAEAQYRQGNYKQAAANQRSYVAAASKKDKNYAIANYNLGYTLFQQKQYADARAAFQKAVDAGMDDAALLSDAYNRIGDTYYYSNQIAKAEESYTQAISKNKGSADYAMFQKAMMAGLSGDHQTKANRLDDMLKAYPNSSLVPSALYEKGVALEHVGKNKEAVNVFNKLITNYSGKEEARKGLLQLALVQNNLNNQTAAIEAYKKVIKQAPTSDEAKIATEDLKSIYADRGELNDFAKFLKTIPNAPQLNVSDVDRLTFEAAEKAAVAGKPSISKMEDYLTKYPNGAYRAQALYYVGRYDYEKGNLNNAIIDLNSALAMAPDASFAEDALAMKCDILNRQGKTQEAIDTYKQIVEKSSSEDNKVLAQLGIIRSSMKLEKWKDVSTTADALLKNHTLSANEEAEVKLARAVAAARQGRMEAAETDFRALAKDPQSKAGAQATYELANLLYAEGNYKTAEKTINNFFKAKSQQTYWIGKCYILLADVYYKQGKTAEAREYIESLKTTYPGKEADILSDIDSRLNKWGAKNKPAAAGTAGKSNKNNNSSADNKSGSNKKNNKK